ncbi:MAG: alpha/beta hydrolase [Micrococcus sp.]|nr:alpha/beta hydrolase [Micrococcus sp.]
MNTARNTPQEPARPRPRPRRSVIGWFVAGIGALIAAVAAVFLTRGRLWDTRATTASAAFAAPEDMVAHPGLRYATQPGQGGVVDVYTPRGPGPFPVLLWTFGSGWTSDQGNRHGDRIARALVPHGYAVAAFSVRNSGQGKFPSHVQDAKAAVRWLRGHARILQLDPQRMAIGGNSSGGWIAMMTATTNGDPEFEGLVGQDWGVDSRVQAAVNFFAPVDFLDMDGQMLPGACADFNKGLGISNCHSDDRGFESRMLGVPVRSDAALVRKASPRTHVTHDSPPTLIVHGTRDMVVPHQQSMELYRTLVEHDVSSIYYEVHGGGHVVDLARDNNVATAQVHRHHVPESAAREHFTWEAVAAFLDAEMPGRG